MILNFFEKMEKNNADMDVTCKFNTSLEMAFFPFFEPFCADKASKFVKSGLKGQCHEIFDFCFFS